MEEWKDIKDWPYQISSLGRVRRVNIVTPIKTQKKYHRIALSRGRSSTQRSTDTERAFYVHRLVAEAFIGSCPDGKSHVAHRDGNPLNNVPENLYWATPKENADDRARHNNYVDGERHFATKLSDDSALIIRARYHIGRETIASIARLFSVSEQIIRCIVKGRTYKSVGGFGL